MSLLTEHSAKIKIDLPEGVVHKQMSTFYNPVMVSNRNISVLLLNCLDKTQLKIADPLAGSGIRSLRFLQELKKNKIKELHINDFKDNFRKTFTENLKLNKIKKSSKIILHQEEATSFLNQSQGFDYIEIDPFGSPNPFLAAAVNRISRGGILAVTATDTAALTGTYPKVTKRKYWAKSLKNYLMHEIGLRILIRKVQLQGIQFDKALTPILAYHKDHYFRFYFRAEKGKEKCDKLIKQQQYLLFCPHCLNFKTSPFNREKCSCGEEFHFAGPLWVGDLSEKALLQKMQEENCFHEERDFLDLLASEISCVGFYDLHQLAGKLKHNPPRIESVLKKVVGTRTHFSLTGIKSKKSLAEIKKIIF